MEKIIKWGILATGRIAHKFATDLKLVPDAEFYAVASRDKTKSEDFKNKYGAKVSYGSYEELTLDPEVEVVYIATPHSMHFNCTMMCLEAGKHVLCEKPVGMNSVELDQMIKKAKEKGVFFMEALWTRFIPSYLKFRELVLDGTIGEPKYVQSDFGFVAPPTPGWRFVNKTLGGGSLLDIGIYPVFLSLDLFGVPESIEARAILNKYDIDEVCSMVFEYRKKQLLTALSSTIAANTPVESAVYGTRGNVKLNRWWHTPTSVTLTVDGRTEQFDFDEKGFGYQYEAMEVNNCIKKGATESEVFPLRRSVELHKTLDLIRGQIGLKYEADR